MDVAEGALRAGGEEEATNVGHNEVVAVIGEVAGPAGIDKRGKAEEVLGGGADGAGDLHIDLEVVGRHRYALGWQGEVDGSGGCETSGGVEGGARSG